jgi:hypothetical protein
MEVTFFGTYDRQMFLEALQLTEKRSTLHAVLRYLALGLSLLIIGGSLYGWFTEGMNPSEIGRLLRNLITASLIGYYYFGGLIARNRSIASLFRSGPERTMQGNANLEGISIGPKDHRALIQWDRFVSKGEKDGLFALRTVDGSVAVFHRDFFATESDWQRFRQLANQRVVEPK